VTGPIGDKTTVPSAFVEVVGVAPAGTLPWVGSQDPIGAVTRNPLELLSMIARADELSTKKEQNKDILSGNVPTERHGGVYPTNAIPQQYPFIGGETQRYRAVL
jgi:hypothetical protein